MMIFLLNKIFLAMATRDLGDHMIVAFNILIILLVVLNSNSAIASIYSREGRSSYLIKTQPCDPPLLIISKLMPNATFGLAALVATFVILILTLPISVGECLMLCLALACIYLAHLFFSAELDLMNPEIEMYATVGSTESNPNETKSTVVAFIVAFAVAGLFFLLLLEPGGQNQYLKLLLVSAAVLIYTVWMFFTKLKLYYREK
jgi:ribose/xylose/arabinose/galactoside ABC-type transport system permease subunit